MKNLAEKFAENLRFLRKSEKLTQKELAAKMGYSEKAVSKWESGMTIPPAETLVELAEVLQTSVDTLLEYVREPKYYLGIDGGATKTMFALSDAKGNVIRTTCLGPCNPVDIGFDKAEGILTDGIHRVCHNIPCSEVSLFAGISGGNAGCNAEIFTEFFKRFRFSSIGIGNDAMNIISAGLGDGNGIAVIMGTGCIAYSQSGEKLAQYGGFGYLFDNGGDGYNVGRDAVHVALYDETGGGKHTLITSLLAEKLGGSANEMITSLYEKGKSYIASLSTVVFEAYDRGDAVAEEILRKNMAEIANLIDTAMGDFDVSEYPVRVVFVGGLSKRSDVLFGFIKEKLKYRNNVVFSVYPYEPVLGALCKAGAPVDTQSDNGITRKE